MATKLSLVSLKSSPGGGAALELATCTGTYRRYTREVVASILEVEDEWKESEARSYRLTEGHGEVLLKHPTACSADLGCPAP
jgi:hypothetical protein